MENQFSFNKEFDSIDAWEKHFKKELKEAREHKKNASNDIEKKVAEQMERFFLEGLQSIESKRNNLAEFIGKRKKEKYSETINKLIDFAKANPDSDMTKTILNGEDLDAWIAFQNGTKDYVNEFPNSKKSNEYIENINNNEIINNILKENKIEEFNKKDTNEIEEAPEEQEEIKDIEDYTTSSVEESGLVEVPEIIPGLDETTNEGLYLEDKNNVLDQEIEVVDLDKRLNELLEDNKNNEYSETEVSEENHTVEEDYDNSDNEIEQSDSENENENDSMENIEHIILKEHASELNEEEVKLVRQHLNISEDEEITEELFDKAKKEIALKEVKRKTVKKIHTASEELTTKANKVATKIGKNKILKIAIASGIGIGIIVGVGGLLGLTPGASIVTAAGLGGGGFILKNFIDGTKLR